MVQVDLLLCFIHLAGATYCCRLYQRSAQRNMQTQRLHQPTVCSQTLHKARFVRVRGLQVCADASARVRGDARRVSRWLSDVRHWKSFYPGMLVGPVFLTCLRSGVAVLLRPNQPETWQSTAPRPSTRQETWWVGQHVLCLPVMHLHQAASLPRQVVNVSCRAVGAAEVKGGCVLCRHQVCCQAGQCFGTHPCRDKV